MYNKIFTKILDSSIWLESDTTRVVWITMIAAMDETGFCQFASVANLAHRARVNPEMAETAVATLEGPDPNSSDPDNEGRRIERVPGGWIVLNAEKYRAIVSRATGQEGTRRRVQAFRERKRSGVENRITEQEHKCACCFQPFDKPYNLYVVQDHNHDTLEQRGLICQSCNKCVGMVENGKPFVSKDPTIYVEYLKRYGNGSVMAVTELKRIGNGKVTQSESEAYANTDKSLPRAKRVATKTEAQKTRHAEFKAAIGKYWDSRNPGVEMPWGPAEGKNLEMWLKESPNTSLEQFTAFLRNRFKSEVNHTERPSRWIRSVTGYAGGPLDRFSKPLTQSQAADPRKYVNA